MANPKHEIRYAREFENANEQDSKHGDFWHLDLDYLDLSIA